MMLRCLIPVVLIAFAATGAAEDQIEIDNSWVHVLRVKQEPHAKTSMLDLPASVTVYLTDVHQRFTGEDRKTRDLKRKAGDVAYASAVKRSEENLSDKPLEL